MNAKTAFLDRYVGPRPSDQVSLRDDPTSVFEKGDQEALGLDYVPLPDNAVKAIEASWKGIQGSGM